MGTEWDRWKRYLIGAIFPFPFKFFDLVFGCDLLFIEFCDEIMEKIRINLMEVSENNEQVIFMYEESLVRK